MIRLYRAEWSTNCERVSLALAYKGLTAESVVIDYGDRSVVERVSGQPLVPVIDDGGTVVADSLAILRHLEDTRPVPPLFPREPARRAELDLFLDWFERVWKRSPNLIEAELGKELPDRSLIAREAELMRRRLDLVEDLLDGRDHLLGPELSAADCAAFPFLKYAAYREEADGELFHRILDEHQSVAGRPRLEAWIERVDERPRAY